MKQAASNGIVHLVSKRSVDEILASLLSLLQTKAITVFAVVDHSNEAAKVGIEMPNTKLVIFGNPKAGTLIMLAAPVSALDLPLKILIAEQADGTTWISYNDPAYLQRRYELTSELTIIVAGIEKIATAIAG